MTVTAMLAGFATLLLVDILPGTPVTPLGRGVFYEEAGMARSLMIVGREEAVVSLDAASREAGAATEEAVLLGYRSVLVRRLVSGGMREQLWIDFGGDHIVLSSEPAENAAPSGAPRPLRAAFRPGPRAGRHPGSIEMLLDGLRLEDTAGRVPIGFFEGPLTLEIRAAAGE